MASTHVLWDGKRTCISCNSKSWGDNSKIMFRVGFGKETKAFQKAGILCETCLIDLKNSILRALVVKAAGGASHLEEKANSGCWTCDGTGLKKDGVCHCVELPR